MQAAVDLGNDSVKSYLDNDYFEMPSAIAASDTNFKAETFTSKAQQDDYFKHFLDHMDVSIASPAVHDTNRYYVGKRADSSSLTPIRFDPNDFSGKSQNDLSMILMLSTLAGKAVSESYEKVADLFAKPIDLHVNLVTSLPIREAKKRNVIEDYQNKYKSTVHTVTFYNFDRALTVSISFDNVLVTLEGQATQVAIANGLLNSVLLANYRTRYPNLVQDVDFSKLRSSLVIDLGGKTSDFAVIEAGNADINLSDSVTAGYDKVLLQSLRDLQDLNRNFRSIAGLENYLKQGPSAFDPSPYKQVQSVIRKNSQNFVPEILNGLSQILARGINPEVIFICGGGASAMYQYTNLNEVLQDTLKRFNGEAIVPIIWIDEDHASKTNALGLKLLLDSLYSQED